MNLKIKTQKGFIQIPLLIIAVIIVAVSVGIGIVLYEQGKFGSLVASVSNVFEKNEEGLVPEQGLISEEPQKELQERWQEPEEEEPKPEIKSESVSKEVKPKPESGKKEVSQRKQESDIGFLEQQAYQYEEAKETLAELLKRVDYSKWALEFYGEKVDFERFDKEYCPNHLCMFMPWWRYQIMIQVGIGDSTSWWFRPCQLFVSYQESERRISFPAGDPSLFKTLSQLEEEGKLEHFDYYTDEDSFLLPKLKQQIIEAWSYLSSDKKQEEYSWTLDEAKWISSKRLKEIQNEYNNLTEQIDNVEKIIKETEPYWKQYHEMP